MTTNEDTVSYGKSVHATQDGSNESGKDFTLWREDSPGRVIIFHMRGNLTNSEAVNPLIFRNVRVLWNKLDEQYVHIKSILVLKLVVKSAPADAENAGS